MSKSLPPFHRGSVVGLSKDGKPVEASRELINFFIALGNKVDELSGVSSSLNNVSRSCPVNYPSNEAGREVKSSTVYVESEQSVLNTDYHIQAVEIAGTEY